MSYIPDFVETTPVCSVCAAVFLLLLCGAALQDYRTREVTNGIWLMAMIFWVPYALGGTGARFPADAVIFWGLQEWFFCRFYGRADCHAFSSCGFYLWGLGCGLEVYL
ncbi:MAG: hypothetical protein IJ327_00430, partial [Lachnospiraceae bacterium]|nr:hypothetical protein [Lachnospiraceae bacterium]